MRKVRPIQAVVGSDSSAIQLTGGLLVELMVVLMDVERLGLVVQFGRVPAHSDVEGNKRADEIAKGAWGRGRVVLLVPIGRERIRAAVTSLWQKRW